MGWTRRDLLTRSSLAALSLGLGRPAAAGELSAGEFLDLPDGYRCTLIDRFGDAMDDGWVVPARPDGMGCFADDRGRLILFRNHELSAKRAWSAFGDAEPPPQAYDAARSGGVTRVVVDPATLQPLTTSLVLAGTEYNCAGGTTPQGWVSCEETDRDGHGWAFLCRTDQAELEPPNPLRSWGRFRREAIAFDPASGVIWQTEDHGEGVLYRHLPHGVDPYDGRLQAMVVEGRPRADMALGAHTGDRFRVTWVEVGDPSARRRPTRVQARRRGAVTFARNEGICRLGQAVVFVSSLGGPDGWGQVWSLEGDTLTLLHQVEDRASLSMPDNLAATPWGGVLAAEDNYDVDEGGPANHLRVLEPDGRVWTLARSADRSELAGPCFSPDGRVLFVNLQKRDLTVAITGPFPTG